MTRPTIDRTTKTAPLNALRKQIPPGSVWAHPDGDSLLKVKSVTRLGVEVEGLARPVPTDFFLSNFKPRQDPEEMLPGELALSCCAFNPRQKESVDLCRKSWQLCQSAHG
ncbi:hypothetical protein H6F46_11935 [Limnothrix sp. FACHB-1083]|uniref:hypothetical protein n=1 Tax=unclassified Limnothrix TaxID=2632864 RepID=UPI00168135FF|nr:MULTISPECIES: hypothetical protein [unclassified Limnothrix]MBD2161400.1 hypothetical protein [Limnothrix sp. FACHB-1083]MBD2192088.1 hypothetical protein [Limnothrix sp. FACHB-1088]